jgi:hypothetical protein
VPRWQRTVTASELQTFQDNRRSASPLEAADPRTTRKCPTATEADLDRNANAA